MSHRGMFRTFLSIVSVSISAAALLGATPARSAVTIDIPCSGTWNWDAANKILSCQTTTPPAPGAPGCTLSASPSSLSAAGPVTLTASCSNSPTSYTWSASPATTFTGTDNTGSTNTNGATISANTTFTVTATNGTGSGQASKSVQVGAVTGAISCPGFTKTLVVNWDWASSLSKVDTYQTQGGLGTNGILVIPFTPTGPADNVEVKFSAANYPAANMVNTKRLAISTQPCDLNPSEPASVASGSTPSLAYVIGTAPVNFINGLPSAASLTPGVQYYLNVAERKGVTANLPSGTQTCVPTAGSFYPACELRLSLQKPTGH